MVCATYRTVALDYRTAMTHTMLMIATKPSRNDFDAVRFARVSTSTRSKKKNNRSRMKNREQKMEFNYFAMNAVFGHFEKREKNLHE